MRRWELVLDFDFKGEHIGWFFSRRAAQRSADRWNAIVEPGTTAHFYVRPSAERAVRAGIKELRKR